MWHVEWDKHKSIESVNTIALDIIVDKTVQENIDEIAEFYEDVRYSSCDVG